MPSTKWQGNMRNKLMTGRCIVLVAASVLSAAIAVAQAPTEATGSEQLAIPRSGPPSLSSFGIEGLETRVNLKALDSWDVVQLIEFLAYRGGLKNIVIGKGVAGLTTKLKFDDVSVGDALEVVLSVNNLAYTIQGGIITIMGDADYQLLFGTSFYDQKQVKILELKYADPVRVASLLEPIKSSIGTVVSDQVTGTLILIDTPAKIREMEAVAATSDISTVQRQFPTVTRTFVLQNAEVAEIQNNITPILSPTIGAMRVDQRTHALIITDLPHKMKEIESMVAQFDQRSKQVFIEAKIVEVSLEDDFRLGVDWNYLFQGLNPRFSLKTAAQPMRIAGLGGDADVPTGVMTFKTIAAGSDLTLILDALKRVGETKILSNPHIATMDGEKATIKVITDEPYAEAQLETGTTNIVGESIQFIEVGVSLDVTPRINDEEMVSMGIRPEVSSVIRNYQAFRQVPVVRKSMAETKVMIKNGETIIIAGMIVNQKEEFESQVPLLGRIPLVGLLFKSQRESSSNSELIVFLTPRIVSGERPFLRAKDMKKESKPLRTVDPVEVKQLKSLR